MSEKLDKEMLREMPSRTYREEVLTDEFVEFTDSECLPKFEFSGYNLAEKHRLARHILHNLLHQGLRGRVVADARSHAPGAMPRIQVWDEIVGSRMARRATGSEMSGRVTLYFPTKKLFELRQLWELERLRGRHYDNGPLVKLSTGKRNLITGELLPPEKQHKPIDLKHYIRQRAGRDPEGFKNGMNYIRVWEDLIREVNDFNNGHLWLIQAPSMRVDGSTTQSKAQVSTSLRLIWSGHMHRYGRLYTFGPMGAQGVSKDLRRRMTISGEPAAELDFSGYHTLMLYNFCRPFIEVEGDPYKPGTILPRFWSDNKASEAIRAKLRQIIKIVTNACWNTFSRRQAEGVAFQKLKEAPSDVRQVIYDIEQSNPQDLLERIEFAHQALMAAGRFYSNIGEDLMQTDGYIMLDILLQLVRSRVPVLGIHDSVVVRSKDVEVAEKAMRSSYYRFVLREPRICRVF
ncbi:MAG: hypothetical protein GWP14_06890 [Actinobacteria bacterium]|nr:hypothetical protein [Actinomycetota bacterium]